MFSFFKQKPFKKHETEQRVIRILHRLGVTEYYDEPGNTDGKVVVLAEINKRLVCIRIYYNEHAKFFAVGEGNTVLKPLLRNQIISPNKKQAEFQVFSTLEAFLKNYVNQTKLA